MKSNIKITEEQYSTLNENAIDKSFNNIGFDFIVGKEVALYKLCEDNHDVIHNYVITGFEIIHRIVPIPKDSKVFIKISEKNDYQSTLGWVLFNRA
jgi:hypothetical protein